MQKPNDLNQSRIVLKQDSTLIAVIEMSLSSWLVAGIVPGVERQPLKKLAVDESALLKLLNRWREEAEKAGRSIERIAVAFEAGRDGFWLARWLRARDIEAHVIHASSVAVSREQRAKTDRLDTELLKRVFLGWLRGERDHCKMVAIPTIKDEDAKRPNREPESLVGERTRIVNRMKTALIRLDTATAAGSKRNNDFDCLRQSTMDTEDERGPKRSNNRVQEQKTRPGKFHRTTSVKVALSAYVPLDFMSSGKQFSSEALLRPLPYKRRRGSATGRGRLRVSQFVAGDGKVCSSLVLAIPIRKRAAVNM
jgi:transposase